MGRDPRIRNLLHLKVGLVSVTIGIMKGLIGLLIGFALGAVCRCLDIPVPSPPKLLGALLVVATTVGYMAADRVLAKRVDEGAKIVSTAR